MLGWKLDGAPPEIAAAARWLHEGVTLANASSVAAVCEVAGGETVYLEVRDGHLILSDRGETCRYLERGDSAHRAMGEEEIRRVCVASGADLVAVPDRWPHITVSPDRARTVADAVAIVGQAIETVFATALIVPVK